MFYCYNQINKKEILMKKTLLLLVLPLSISLASCWMNKKDPKPKDLYYLPSLMKVSMGDELMSSHSYEYFDNKYVETILVADQEGKRVVTHEYNDDFSRETILVECFDDSGVLYYGNRYETEYFSNGSYETETYSYVEEEKSYCFEYIRGAKYNSFKQEETSFLMYPTENEEILEISWYYVSEFNELGLETKYESYTGFYGEGCTPVKDYYSTYTYNEDFSKCTIQDYYVNNKGEALKDGYTESDIYVENGIRYLDEQIYFEDGEKGNHNKFGYDGNMNKVYSLYGGLSEETILHKNSDGLLSQYVQNIENENTVMDIVYNEKSNIASTETTRKIDSVQVSKETVNYTYDSNDQLVKAKYESTTEDKPLITEVTYSTKQNDKLLKHMGFYQDIIEENSPCATLVSL